jgi:signal transduction histidine kinase
MHKKETYFVIDVIDTGIGIPEDKFDVIFEKFSKLSRSNKYGSKFKGLGLGLYISRRDAEKIGGKIFVRSVVGSGSVFTLILPIMPNVNNLTQET